MYEFLKELNETVLLQQWATECCVTVICVPPELPLHRAGTLQGTAPSECSLRHLVIKSAFNYCGRNTTRERLVMKTIIFHHANEQRPTRNIKIIRKH